MDKQHVSILIPIKDDKILILKRSESSSWSGYWNFPGGSVEPKEPFLDAAVRELEEESGLIVEKDSAKPIGMVETDDKNLYFYISKEFSNEVVINEESSDYAWISLDEISNYKFLPLNEDFLKVLRKHVGRDDESK